MSAPQTTISNAEFGRRIGVSRSMASRLRSGQRRGSVGTMRRIHQEYGIPLVDLMEAHHAGPGALGKLIRQKVA